jgi:Fic family protein
MSACALKKEFERLTIELSWKSSQIEGNTYSLIDTEILIKEGKAAKGHSRDEAVMILNHKKAIEYIFSRKGEFSSLNLKKIENVHSLLADKLSTEKGMRKRPVGITGTRYRPLDNQHQIREAIEKMCETINNKKIQPLAKALASILLISYIQPFEDGNKRTARLVGNAVLFAHGFCPLSYRSVDEAEYKKAIMLFYEQNSARYFKELFVSQFRFAVKNYFLA